MARFTGISWTDHTFSPWWGCVRVSPGCKHCYAADLAGRYGQGWTPTSERRFMTAAWNDPPKWNRAAQKAGRPAFVFCASMADVFEDVPEHVREQTAAARVRLWALIRDTPWLVWLLLTKRPERVVQTVPVSWLMETDSASGDGWPSNVWIGTTVEDQEHAEKRLPHLLDVPAVRHFVSYEPALGPVDFTRLDVFKAPTWPESLKGEPKTYLDALRGEGLRPSRFGVSIETRIPKGLDWVIIGGESGGKARPFRAEWARDAIRQCKEAGVAPWMKQLGDASDLPKRAHHGADPAEWPEDLRVQERPTPAPPA